MHLFSRIVRHLALVLILLMTLWAVLFFYAMMDEIRDEADDSLEHYSAVIISRVLAGRELPQLGDGSNNSYVLMPVSQEYAASHPHITYHDENFFIADKGEEEPARVITTIFSDDAGHYYELKVATPTFEKNDLFESIAIWIVVLYVGLLLVVLAVIALVLYRHMHPLYALLDWLESYRPGCKPKPLPGETRIKEFRKLRMALQRAIERSELMLERQAQFIGDASHELQTPLAIIGNRIEWLMNSDSLTEEEATELYKIHQTLLRAVRLNKTLLLLTKIDNHQFPESTDVDIVQLIRDYIENYGEVFESRGVTFRVDLPEQYVVHMNESLAQTLVNNLIKNTYIHAPEQSVAHVELREGVMTISNEGVESLDAEHVFDRFYKASKKHTSTGLGLALVAAVCRLYDMPLEYGFEQGHHRFTVKF